MNEVRPVWKKRWLRLSVALMAAATFFEFATNSFGFGQLVVGLISAPRAPSVTAGERAPHCIRFAFEHLPADFTVGNIVFRIVDRFGPVPMGGDMAAIVVPLPVNIELSPTVFSQETSEFPCPVELQSERDGDAAIVDLCATLTMPGMRGHLVVVPSFYSLGGKRIRDLDIVTETGTPIELGLPLVLSRPKNASVSVNKPAVKRPGK